MPPFDSGLAMSTVREDLRVSDVSEVFSAITPEPVAAASLGQVYRGALPDGTPIALKVQRPRMARQIALDMLLIREVLTIIII